VVLAGVGLAVAGLFALESPTPPRSDGPGTPAGSDADATAQAAARRFLERYVAADGRVRRIDQGDDTVSEGQAYGLLLAAAVGDQARFDAVQDWTARNLRRPDGLFASRWRDGRVEDPQAAADAEVDYARALLVGACSFDRSELRGQAEGLGRAVLAEETAAPGGRPVLVAGPWARGEAATINPSYFAPATFAALQRSSGDGRFGLLAASSRELVAELQEAGPLPPDWARLDARGRAQAIGTPSSPGAPIRYGFDAARTLVRLAEDPDPAGPRLAGAAWSVFRGKDRDEVAVVERELSGSPAGNDRHPVALVGAAGAASAAGDGAAAARLLDAAEALDRRAPTYYGSAWVALGRLMLTTDRLTVCSD